MRARETGGMEWLAGAPGPGSTGIDVPHRSNLLFDSHLRAK
jgi:hypothetical protein